VTFRGMHNFTGPMGARASNSLGEAEVQPCPKQNDAAASGAVTL